VTQFLQIAVLFDIAKIYYFQHCFSRSFDSSQPYRIWSQRCLCHIFVSYCSRYAFDHQTQSWHFMHFILPFQWCQHLVPTLPSVKEGDDGRARENKRGGERVMPLVLRNLVLKTCVENVLPSSLVRFRIIEVSRVVQGLATINWFTDTFSASHVPTFCVVVSVFEVKVHAFQRCLGQCLSTAVEPG